MSYFYIRTDPIEPPGFCYLSTANDWAGWVRSVVPGDSDADVRNRIVSNLKHVLVGLELKAGLIIPHGKRVFGRPVLFESYCQVLTFEFCVGVFSVCEGLGSIHHLLANGADGSAGVRVRPDDWRAALVEQFDPSGSCQLQENVQRTKSVRDKIHQDRLGARGNIDWHQFVYSEAFVPAKSALQPLFARSSELVPQTTNLLDA